MKKMKKKILVCLTAVCAVMIVWINTAPSLAYTGLYRPDSRDEVADFWLGLAEQGVEGAEEALQEELAAGGVSAEKQAEVEAALSATPAPTAAPTAVPTEAPQLTPEPTAEPTAVPTEPEATPEPATPTAEPIPELTTDELDQLVEDGELDVQTGGLHGFSSVTESEQYVEEDNKYKEMIVLLPLIIIMIVVITAFIKGRSNETR